MFALMAAAAFVAPPVRFELNLPGRVVPGEFVKVQLVAKNTSDHPVVLTKLGPDGFDLGVRVTYDVERAGKRVERDGQGNLIAQWIVGRDITESAFEILEPGEALVLVKETFAHEFPHTPNTKDDWAKLDRTPLRPGVYTVRARYSFHRTFDSKVRNRSIPWARSLTPRASRLYHQTWTGTVDLAGKFEVTPER